jgi:hypothetical protein
VVKFHDPVSTTWPSTTTNLWCMIARRLSSTMGMPACVTVLNALFTAALLLSRVSESVTIRTLAPRPLARAIAWATFDRSKS